MKGNKKFNIIFILLNENTTIKLYNITLVPEYNSNFILLGQFQENSIIYHNSLMAITLMRKNKIIIHTKSNQKFFMVDLTLFDQVISIRRKLKIMEINRQYCLSYLIKKINIFIYDIRNLLTSVTYKLLKHPS